MPIKKSAIKRAKQNIERRDHNRALKKAFRVKIKDILKKAAAGEAKKATKDVSEAYKALDKAAKKGAIHKNTAARKKSRLAKKLKAETQAKKETPKKEEK